ncbi:MAG: hypothetical protein KGQ60_05740 [Planctomycetes bacterium]|nr:hypothetical protein [Planctomycetota bacterium]
MRRMMHAIFLLVFFNGALQAQSTGDSRATLSPNFREVSTPSQNLQLSISKQQVSSEESPSVGHLVGVEFIPIGCDQPYSQLATRMACSDASPNLWGCYSHERAALAAKVMKHVDLQCDCTQGGCSKLNSVVSDPAVPNHACRLGASAKVHRENRYKQPVSVLYGVPSADCGSGKCHLSSKKMDTQCTGCGQ